MKKIEKIQVSVWREGPNSYDGQIENVDFASPLNARALNGECDVLTPGEALRLLASYLDSCLVEHALGSSEDE